MLAASVAFLLAAALCGAQQSWEGNAAAVRRDAFATPGLYAASNSFPTDSRIEVRSLVSGQTVQVTVVQRIKDTDGIFLLLSEEAAEKLGLSEGEVIRVSARVIPAAAARPAAEDGERAFNQDPDINPAAELEDFSLAPTAAAAPTEEAATEGELAAEEELPAAGETSTVQTPPETVELEAPLETSIPEAVAQPEPSLQEAPPKEPPMPPVDETPGEKPGVTAEQERLTELRERLPQKQVFQPPRQSERFALKAPGEPQEPPVTEPAAEEGGQEEPAVEEAAPAAAAEPEVTEQPEVAEEPEAVEEPEMAEIAEEPEPEVAAAETGPGAEGPEPSLSAPEELEEALVLQLPPPRPLEPERPEPEGTRLPVPEEAEPLALEPELPPVELPTEEPVVTEAPEGPAQPPAETVEPLETAPEVVETPPAAEGEVREPAEPSPPEIAVAPAQRPGAGELPLTTVLTPKAYFLQLGAYSSRTLAEKLASELGPGYEISILPTEDSSRIVYRVLIGPLNTDESGTLLYLFKARGFKDAFLRYVE